jgi:enoyl-CoA hydratase
VNVSNVEAAARPAHVQVEKKDAIAIVTIARPEKLNALNRAVLGELDCAFAGLFADAAVRAIVLTGAGEKAFVAGADIGELAVLDTRGAEEASAYGSAIFRRIAESRAPVIAAVNGFALGGGCELALACAIRIASENAKFGLPEVGLGIIPGYGGTQRLPRIVGEARALEMIMTGRTVDAAEAERIGLVHRIVEGEAVAAGAAFAREFACHSLPVLACARSAVRRALDTPLSEGLKIEADLSGIAYQTEDAAEGMAAFIEKRKARFKDR